MTTQLNRMPPLAIYKLKRDYGAPIDIYKLTSSSTSSTTGVKTASVTVTHVKLAVVMPTSITRAYVFASKMSKQHASAVGNVDMNSLDFVVDRADTPLLTTISNDDWIVYQSRKYQIEKITVLESGWIVTANELVGEIPQQTISIKVDNSLNMADTANGTA